MRLLYIDVDSLRADHLGCYGYHRNTSPNIDSLASEGVVFREMYATDTPCLPSRTAFFLGRPGVETGVVNHGGRQADLPREEGRRGFRSPRSRSTLGAALRRAGVKTASISPFPERHSGYIVWHGFQETLDTGRGGLDDAHEVFPFSERWLRQNGQDENWFLHVNLWDPHTPYDHPESFGNPFEDEPIDPWLTQEILDKQNASYGPHSATEVSGFDDKLPAIWRMGRGRIRSLEDAKAHLDGYDTGIRYADLYIGRMVELLNELGIYEETAVVVSADHGENQGELNVWGDHQTADRCTNRIPAVVRWPGRTESKAGQTLEGLHYHLDLSATFVDWMGAEVPEGWFGKPMTLAEEGRKELVLSHGAWSCQRSVRWDNWLIIRTYHTGLKEFPEYMLFDVEQDPHEVHNLASEKPEVVGEGIFRLDRWLGERMVQADDGDPFWQVMAEGGPHHAKENSPEWNRYLVRLERTNRSEHAERLRGQGGRPFRLSLEG